MNFEIDKKELLKGSRPHPEYCGKKNNSSHPFPCPDGIGKRIPFILPEPILKQESVKELTANVQQEGKASVSAKKIV